MRSILPLIILIGIASSCTNTAANFWDSKNAYLGQTPAADTPKLFLPPGLTDTNGIALDRVAFSPDGKEFYYCHNTNWFNSSNLEIRYFRFDSGRWQGPNLLNKHYNSPTFPIDGNSLYFPGDDSLGGLLAESKRTAGGWTSPIVKFRRKYILYDLMPTSSGNMYIGSNGDTGRIADYNSYDLQLLKVTDGDTTLHNLGLPLNTPGFDGDFYVAPDESYIIISANETKDFECELHISFPTKQGWTKPVSLGLLINDGLAHRWGQYVTPDGKFLFYTKATSEKDCHLYWVRFDSLLAKLKTGHL